MTTRTSVRGAGTPRGGATDTTMLIWKVIHANPGITRDEIFAKIEHDIPGGYAVRRYVNAGRTKIGGLDASRPPILIRARGYVLTQSLASMHKLNRVTRDEQGRYLTTEPLQRYQGDPATIDETGTKAAEHMANATALRTVEKWVARTEGSSRPAVTHKERAAIALLAQRVRAQTSGPPA